MRSALRAARAPLERRGAASIAAHAGSSHATVCRMQGATAPIGRPRGPLLRGAHAWPARAPSRAVHPTWVPFVLTWGPFGGPGLYFEIAPAREPFRVIFWRMAGAGTFFPGPPAGQTPGGGGGRGRGGGQQARRRSHRAIRTTWVPFGPYDVGTFWILDRRGALPKSPPKTRRGDLFRQSRAGTFFCGPGRARPPGGLCPQLRCWVASCLRSPAAASGVSAGANKELR